MNLKLIVESNGDDTLIAKELEKINSFQSTTLHNNNNLAAVVLNKNITRVKKETEVEVKVVVGVGVGVAVIKSLTMNLNK